MLSFLRANTPRTTTAHWNPTTYEDGRASQHLHSPPATYMMTDVLPATTPEHARVRISKVKRTRGNPRDGTECCMSEAWRGVATGGQTMSPELDGLDGGKHV